MNPQIDQDLCTTYDLTGVDSAGPFPEGSDFSHNYPTLEINLEDDQQAIPIQINDKHNVDNTDELLEDLTVDSLGTNDPEESRKQKKKRKQREKDKAEQKRIKAMPS